MGSESVRTRLLDAGMTMGILTLVLGDESGAVEINAGILTPVFGDGSGAVEVVEGT